MLHLRLQIAEHAPGFGLFSFDVRGISEDHRKCRSACDYMIDHLISLLLKGQDSLASWCIWQ